MMNQASKSRTTAFSAGPEKRRGRSREGAVKVLGDSPALCHHRLAVLDDGQGLEAPTEDLWDLGEAERNGFVPNALVSKRITGAPHERAAERPFSSTSS
jgi:hypothetical protein